MKKKCSLWLTKETQNIHLTNNLCSECTQSRQRQQQQQKNPPLFNILNCKTMILKQSNKYSSSRNENKKNPKQSISFVFG